MLADIAVYAYAHLAGDIGIELGEYPAVAAWCARRGAAGVPARTGAIWTGGEGWLKLGVVVIGFDNDMSYACAGRIELKEISRSE